MHLLLTLAAPEAEDVVAGGVGAVILLALFAAVVFLVFSFRKQIRKAQAARDAGVFGDEPVAPTSSTPATPPATDEPGPEQG